MDSDLTVALRKGAREFNAGHFFECHDTLEEVWQGTRGNARDFLQGLIQTAVGFYHLDNGNRQGGESQLEKGLRKLEPYGDQYLGVELSGFCRDVRRWLDRSRAGECLQAGIPELPKLRFEDSNPSQPRAADPRRADKNGRGDA